MEPHREVLWNIHHAWLMYTLSALVFLLFCYVVAVHVRRWRTGRRAKWPSVFRQRLRVFLGAAVRDGLFHLKFFGADRRDVRFRERYAGLMHFFLFGGMGILLLATIMDAFSHYVVDFLHGTLYLWFSLVTDTAGLLILAAIGLALWRRYVWKPPRVDNRREDLVTLGLLFIIVLTGFVVEGFRIAANELPFHPSWSPWSPGGYVLALWFRHLSMPSLLTAHVTAWWTHVGITLAAVVYVSVADNRLLHIFWDPVNIFFRNLGPKGALAPLDFENEEFYGAAKLEDLSWKQLLDTDACTRCGRCQDACPAYASGKALDPRQLIQDLKQHLYDVSPGVFRLKPATERQELLGEVISDEVIWDCTTCRACVQACPVAVEHVDTLMDLRRDLAMEQSRFPEAAQEALKSLSSRGHPYRGTTATRTDWCEGLEVPVLSDGARPEVLFWVGCSAALDERTMKVARATVKVLRAAGVNFAVLGDEETCCGDPARRMGDEYLFQTICRSNIETLNNYAVTHILTICPHCYNSFLNEYPQFGGNFKVEHHSTFISRLVEQGALTLKPSAGTVTFHDSCYLGRYNDIYRAPRDILHSVNGHLVAMDKRLTDSFCCGGGGGHMGVGGEPGQRGNHRRGGQGAATGGGVLPSIATGEPRLLLFPAAIAVRLTRGRVDTMLPREVIVDLRLAAKAQLTARTLLDCHDRMAPHSPDAGRCLRREDARARRRCLSSRYLIIAEAHLRLSTDAPHCGGDARHTDRPSRRPRVVPCRRARTARGLGRGRPRGRARRGDPRSGAQRRHAAAGTRRRSGRRLLLRVRRHLRWPSDLVLAHAGRVAGVAIAGDRSGPQAGATRPRAPAWHHHGHMDVRPAAGDERSLQLREAGRRCRRVRGELLRRVDQRVAPRHAHRPPGAELDDHHAARAAPSRAGGATRAGA